MSYKTEINFQPLSKIYRPSLPPLDRAVIALVPFILLSFAAAAFGLPMYLQPIIWSVFIVYAASQIKRAKEIKSTSNDAMLQFAVANNFGLNIAVQVEGRPGSLFTHGNNKRIFNQFTGKFQDIPFQLFNYSYIVGSGRNRRRYDCSVMELQLKRKLPHMVIDSLVEKGSFGSSTLPIDFDASQKINLEGDFYKYFALYAPDTYGVSALTIIAPDVMERLMQHAALCDIEVIDDKMYFYWPEFPEDAKTYEDMFNTVTEILEEVGRKLQSANIFAHPTQAQIHSQPATNGVRLKKRKLWPYILLVVGTYIGLQFLQVYDQSTGMAIFASLSYFPIMFIFLWPQIYNQFNRKRLHKSLQERLKDYEHLEKAKA